MATFKFVQPEKAEGKTKEVFDDIKKKFGMVPNIFKGMGYNPEFAEALLGLKAVAGKALDPKTRELICLAVSAINKCEYCLEAHAAAAAKSGCTEAEIAAAFEVAACMSAFNQWNNGAMPEVDLSRNIK